MPAPTRPSGPLAGVLVLDLGMNIAGPYACTVLGNFGATVVKVEGPRGDACRAFPPFVAGTGTLFATMNQNKRYVAVDLKQPTGRDVMGRLVERADVLVQNLRYGKDDLLGIDAERCHARNPRLVHCSVEGFYPDERERPGYDLLIQAESGILSLTGEPDGGPSRLPGSMIDLVTGLWLASAATAALHGPRDRAALRVTMLDVAMWLVADKISAYLATGEQPTRLGSHLSTTTPLGAYPATDGYVVIGAATDDMFGRLAEVLGPPVAGDDRFRTQAGRLQHRDDLTTAIEGRLRDDTVDAWFEALEGANVPVARVLTLPEAVARHARSSATGLHQRGSGAPARVAPPVDLGDGAIDVGAVPGEVGRDTEAVLTSIGFSDAELRALRDRNVIVG